MSTIDTLIMIILVIFLIFLVVGGVGLYFAIKLGKAATRKARQAIPKIATHVNAMGTGEAAEAERMRVNLRREVQITRQAVDQAVREGWGLGELPTLVAEVAKHADLLDSQLGTYAQQRRATGLIDHVGLDRLRDHHTKLITTCARIRADLLNDQLAHSATGLADLQGRTDLELEARRSAPDPLDEIDELYRRTLQHNPPKDQPGDYKM
ncbi:hypothetical protein [Thermocatellispora tengchongensis]|uniref:hypothetical protein n=1 Tax=Thermocatellispora tengchongensis TaxID=1073253 RepID=UPI00160D34BC